MKLIGKGSVLVSLMIILLMSCEGDDNNNQLVDSFDRKAMLTNWADNIIIPAFKNYQDKTIILKSAKDKFVDSPSNENLSDVRSAFFDTYKAWQHVSMFNLGKAKENSIRNFTNIYPTSPEEIEANVTAGTYDLALPSKNNEQGLPAIDYLINGLAASDEAILDLLTGNRLDYLSALIDRLNVLSTEVVDDWENGYRDEYINNNGSSKTAAVDETVNAVVFYYEKFLREAKISLPSGARTGNPLPGLIEAKYSTDAQKELYMLGLMAFSDFFNGKHFNGTGEGPSLGTYIDELQVDGDLTDRINTQLVNIMTKAALLEDDFQRQIETNNEGMLNLFDDMQTLIPAIKAEMTSLLSITVNFQDADGD